MPEFRSLAGGRAHSYGAVSGSSSVSLQITAGSAANTKGNAAELTSATSFDANWMLVQLTDAGTGGTPMTFLVDILAGSSPESVLVADLCVPAIYAGTAVSAYLFPVFIPRGTRLAARCQSSTANATIRVSVTLIAGTMLSGTMGAPNVIAYGVGSNSRGALIDPGGVANTDSAWVELTSATVRDHHWIAVGGLFGDLAINNTAWRVQVGVGSSPEQPILTWHVSGDPGIDQPLSSVICLPCFIPRGTRVVARLRSSTTNAGDRTANLILWGA